MRNRFLEGGAAKRLIASLAPPFDRDVVETGFGEMMSDRFGLAVRIAQRLGRASVKRLTAVLSRLSYAASWINACLKR